MEFENRNKKEIETEIPQEDKIGQEPITYGLLVGYGFLDRTNILIRGDGSSICRASYRVLKRLVYQKMALLREM